MSADRRQSAASLKRGSKPRMADPAGPRPLVVALLLRAIMRTAYAAQRALWFAHRPSVRGVRALAVTRDRRVVLVKHTYVPGWYLPGGGIKDGETSEAAVLRELAEEIGLVGHSKITPLFEFRQRIDHREDHVSALVVEGVEYQPRLSLEIEAIREFDPITLPPDATPRTRHAIELWLTRAAKRGEPNETRQAGASLGGPIDLG